MSEEIVVPGTIYIYTLSDPRSPDQVRYVGATVDPAARLRVHVHAKKGEANYRTNWIGSLVKDGLKPCMLVIDNATDETWEERERFWIAHYREAGARLVNGTDGGRGTAGLSKKTDRRGKYLRDFTGEVYEHLTVIADGGGYTTRFMDVECSCGNKYAMRAATWGKSKSCGRCDLRVGHDLTGETFASLTVVEDSGIASTRTIRVRCSCGGTVTMQVKHWDKQKTCGQCTGGIRVKEGMTFEHLTVTRLYSITKETGYRQRVAECICACGGASPQVCLTALVNRKTKSCLVCSRVRSAAAKRIPDRGPLYKSWKSAMAKVCASRGKDRPGERCTYEEFKSWAIKSGYIEGLFLVRKDVSRGVSLNNLYWSKNRKPSSEERARH